MKSDTGAIDWLYQSFTAHLHQKGHTVPKQVSPLDDDDDITEPTRKKNVVVLQAHILKKSIQYQGACVADGEYGNLEEPREVSIRPTK